MIPPPDYNHKDNYGLFDTFEMKHCKPENLGFNDAMSVTEKTHAFDDSMFYCTDGVNIDGYLQTEDYFVHIADQIREDFTFRKDYLEPCKEYIDSLVVVLFLFTFVSLTTLEEKNTTPSSRYHFLRVR